MVSLIYKVKGVDEANDAWYYVMVDINKLEGFLKDLNDDIIHLKEYGVILHNAYESDAPDKMTDKIKKDWGIE